MPEEKKLTERILEIEDRLNLSVEKRGQFILFSPHAFYNWIETQSVKRSIVRIQNHQTYRPNYEDFDGDNHFKLCENMKKYHVEKRGFSDIAMNLTTFPDGTIMLCRPLNVVPAGIKGANTGSICIEHLGDFDIDGDTMSEEHRDCIIYLNAVLLKKFNLEANSNSIVYHHWWTAAGKRTNGINAAKSCPGTNFFGGNALKTAEEKFIPLIKDYKTLLK